MNLFSNNIINGRKKLIKRTFKLTAAVVLFTLMASFTPVKAQEVGVGSATATVLAALQVVASQALQFGAAVLQGVPGFSLLVCPTVQLVRRIESCTRHLLAVSQRCVAEEHSL